MRFKMDTGADVTVIKDTCIPRRKTPLQKSAKELFGPGHNSLQEIAQVQFKGGVQG